MLVTRHGVWIGNWIYWSLITRNFRQLNQFHESKRSTNHCASAHIKSSPGVAL
jgi:hypothetical protein